MEFPKIRGTLFGGPYNKDPIIWSTILGSPILETPLSGPLGTSLGSFSRVPTRALGSVVLFGLKGFRV